MGKKSRNLAKKLSKNRLKSESELWRRISVEEELPALTCNSCNKEFLDAKEEKLHYKSEWHRYNLKRKVANVPGVTEAFFLARQSAAAAQENAESRETSMLHSCVLCSRTYRIAEAHAQHLKSRSHVIRALKGTSDQGVEKSIIKPLPQRISNKAPQQNEEEESKEELKEADPDKDMINEDEREDDDSSAIEVDLELPCCFMCDREHDTIDSCMVHMRKQHGLIIPDVEYLKDLKGLLTYLLLKAMRDFRCLYCNDNCHPFSSLEGVRKHMEAKSHCKVHYGDGDENEDVELEEFYDYSSSYVDGAGNQLVACDVANSVRLGIGGAELILVRRTSKGLVTRALGSRQFLRYYRQKPRPSPAYNAAMSAALAASLYRRMALAAVQSKGRRFRRKMMKIMKQIDRARLAMRTKVQLKNNVIRNLPKNVPH